MEARQRGRWRVEQRTVTRWAGGFSGSLTSGSGRTKIAVKDGRHRLPHLSSVRILLFPSETCDIAFLKGAVRPRAMTLSEGEDTT